MASSNPYIPPPPSSSHSSLSRACALSVPKKLMFNAAMQREAMVGSVSTAEGYGYQVPESAGNFDWVKVKERRDAYVARLNKR